MPNESDQGPSPIEKLQAQIEQLRSDNEGLKREFAAQAADKRSGLPLPVVPVAKNELSKWFVLGTLFLVTVVIAYVYVIEPQMKTNSAKVQSQTGELGGVDAEIKNFHRRIEELKLIMAAEEANVTRWKISVGVLLNDRELTQALVASLESFNRLPPDQKKTFLALITTLQDRAGTLEQGFARHAARIGTLEGYNADGRINDLTTKTNALETQSLALRSDLLAVKDSLVRSLNGISGLWASLDGGNSGVRDWLRRAFGQLARFGEGRAKILGDGPPND